jgi:hypothetical protein
VSDTGLLRRIFGAMEEKRKKSEEDCIVRSFIHFYLHKMLLG